jgi:hypothetical protein
VKEIIVVTAKGVHDSSCLQHLRAIRTIWATRLAIPLMKPPELSWPPNSLIFALLQGRTLLLPRACAYFTFDDFRWGRQERREVVAHPLFREVRCSERFVAVLEEAH